MEVANNIEDDYKVDKREKLTIDTQFKLYYNI